MISDTTISRNAENVAKIRDFYSIPGQNGTEGQGIEQAVVSGLHSQPQLREVLRPFLTPRHPSQIYEALLEGVLLFTILWLVRTRTREPDGVLTGLFFVCYAIFRIVVEYFREPDASLIAGFTRGQFFSFFLIAIGLAFIIVGKIKKQHAVRPRL